MEKENNLKKKNDAWKLVPIKREDIQWNDYQTGNREKWSRPNCPAKTLGPDCVTRECYETFKK